jgi:hypothetical protein
MATKINFNKVKSELSEAYQSSLKKEATNLAKQILNENLNDYIEQIDQHPVSQELSQGPEGENLSRTLNGVENLFAFIGFEAESKPIEDLKDLVKQNTFLDKKSTFDTRNLQLKFNVFTPSPDEIKTKTPLPFEGGRSWVKGIEDGIPGFGYYVYGLLFPNSRSGKAIQSKNKVRSITYKPVKYISELYQNFIRSLR